MPCPPLVQDGGQYYTVENGALVQDWYSTCSAQRMDSTIRGAAAEKALQAIPQKSRIPDTSAGGAEVVFPYPRTASPTRVMICNYSGKDYWWSRSKAGVSSGGELVRIPSVVAGSGCASVDLAEACSDRSCWERSEHFLPPYSGL